MRESANAEQIVAEELKRRQWSETALLERRKGDKGKLAIALRLRVESTVPLAWSRGAVAEGKGDAPDALAVWVAAGKEMA